MSDPIAFLDESGDVGRRPGHGSSALFVVALTIFANREQSDHCSDHIDQLRRALQKPERFEFRFSANSHAVRLAFLRHVAPLAFTYHAAVLQKRADRIPSSDVVYTAACARVFDQAHDSLYRATVIVDGSGDRAFRQQLAGIVRAQGSIHGAAIAEVRVQRSQGNNLLQLADYVAGAVHRYEQKKPGAEEYLRLLAGHEATSARWPI
ncbi:MAG: DUF3800 domain-containing protein [Dehalococcoidia bacterium]